MERVADASGLALAPGGPRARRAPSGAERLSRDLVERILDHAFSAPRPEEVYCWPVHIRPSDGRFAVRDCQFEARTEGRLRGYWVEAADGGVDFACVDSAVGAEFSDPSTYSARRLCWFQPTEYLDADRRQLACCSVTRDAVRSLAGGSATERDRRRAVRLDPVGVDYSPRPRTFVFRAASLSRALADRYTHRILVLHRLADFVHAQPGFGYWLTATPRADILHLSADDEDRLLRTTAGPLVSSDESASSSDEDSPDLPATDDILPWHPPPQQPPAQAALLPRARRARAAPRTSSRRAGKKARFKLRLLPARPRPRPR